jgi:hypothetical protein
MASCDFNGTAFGTTKKFSVEIIGVTGVLVGIPFASRFRRCVNRVAGAFARNDRDVVDQSA